MIYFFSIVLILILVNFLYEYCRLKYECEECGCQFSRFYYELIVYRDYGIKPIKKPTYCPYCGVKYDNDNYKTI